MPAHTEIWTLIPDLRGLVLTLTDPYVASLGFDRPQPVEQGCTFILCVHVFFSVLVYLVTML